MAESFVQKQVRLVLEQQCREYAELLKAKVPAGVGFILLLSDYGRHGNVAYVATVDRQDSIRLLREWLDQRDPNAKVEENALLRQENSALRDKARRANALFDLVSNGPGPYDAEPTDDEVARVGQLKALLEELSR